MVTPAVLGFALFVSGLGMTEDLWKNRQREQVSSCVFPALFILGGLGLVVYEVTYWLRYFHLIQ